MKKTVTFGIIGLFFTIACSLIPSPSPQKTVSISPEEGGEVVLANGAKLNIPPNSFQENTIISFRKLGQNIPIPKSEFLILSSVYEIDMGDGNPERSYSIALPIPEDLITDVISEKEIFIVYYDQNIEDWVFLGGVADLDKMMISIKLDHASIYSIGKWDWPKWARDAFVEKFFSGSFFELKEALEYVNHVCPAGNEEVYVDSSKSNKVIDGCVDSITDNEYQFSIENRKAFTIDLQVLEGGGGSFEPGRVFRGEINEFSVSTRDQSPLAIRAEMNRETLYIDLTRAFIEALPGMNSALLSAGEGSVRCLYSNMEKVIIFNELAYDINFEQDFWSASEAILKYLLSTEGLTLLLDTAGSCGLSISASYQVEVILASIEEVFSAASLVSSIITSWQSVIYGFSGNAGGDLWFYWPYQAKLDTTTWYAFLDEEGEIWIAHLDGSELHRISNINSKDIWYGWLKWSPDGKYLAAIRRESTSDLIIEVFDIEANDSWDVVKNFIHYDYSWMPNSQSIVHGLPYKYEDPGSIYENIENYPEAYGIYVTDIYSNVSYELFPRINKYPLLSASVSPNQEGILFYMINETGYGSPDTYLGDIKNPSKYLKLEGSGGNSWSPDGQLVAVSPADKNSMWDYYVCPASLTIYTIQGKIYQEYNPGGEVCDYYLDWSPDGKVISIFVIERVNNSLRHAEHLLFLESGDRIEISSEISRLSTSSEIEIICWLSNSQSLIYRDSSTNKYGTYNIYSNDVEPVFSGIHFDTLACP